MPAIHRNTRQKAALRSALLDADRPLSPEEIVALAQRDVPGISLATVYRNISCLVEEGWLAAVELPGAPARYEVAGKQHHHHFQCNRCERVYEILGCHVPARHNVPEGFTVTGHQFLLYGTCAECV